jgi:hypothetical protein
LRGFVRDIRTFLWEDNSEKREMIEGMRGLIDEPSQPQKLVL